MNNGAAPGERFQVPQEAVLGAIGTNLLFQRLNHLTSVVSGQPFEGNLVPGGVPTLISKANWLLMEHIDASIRGYVNADERLSSNVAVFPGYCSIDTKRQANFIIREKMEASPMFARFLPNSTPLPERSTLTGKALIARDNEQIRRNRQNLKLIEMANGPLAENVLFKFFLMACLTKNDLWQGTAPKITGGKQWVVPIRVNDNHYTVLVIHFSSNKHALVQYYDSSGHDLDSNTKSALVDFFKTYKVKMSYQNFSKADQLGDGYNCGVFAFYNAIKLVCSNFKLPNRLNSDWEISSLESSLSNYEHITRKARLYIAGILQKIGQNVFISPELLKNTSRPPLKTAQLQKVLLDEQLQALRTKQNQETSTQTQAEIDALERTVRVFNQMLDEQAQQIQADQQNNNFILQTYDWITSFSWQTLLLTSAAAILFYLFGLPFVMAHATKLFTMLTLMLPANGAVTILGAAFIFTLGFSAVEFALEWLSGNEHDDVNLANALKQMPISAPIVPELTHSKVVLNSTAPTFTPMQQTQLHSKTAEPLRLVANNEENRDQELDLEQPRKKRPIFID